MKNIFLIFLGLSFILSSCATTNSTAGFYSKYKKTPGVQNFKLPGWLISSGSGIAKSFMKEEDKDVEALLKLVKKIKNLRLMVAEDYNPIPANESRELVNNLRKNDFDDIIFVRDGTTTVNIMINLNEKKEKIKDLMIMVNEEDQFVFLSAKTKIKYQDIADLVKTLLDNNLDEKQEPEKKEPPVVKKKRPQA